MRILFFLSIALLPLCMIGQLSPEGAAFVQELKSTDFLTSEEHSHITTSDLDDVQALKYIYQLFYLKDSLNTPVQVGRSWTSSSRRATMITTMVEKTNLIPKERAKDMWSRNLDNPKRDRDKRDIFSDAEAFLYLYQYLAYQQGIKQGLHEQYIDSLVSWELLPQGTDFSPKYLGEIIAKMDNALLINPDTMEGDLAKAYRYGMNQVSKLDTRLAFRDFAFEVVQGDSSEGLIELARISFICGNRKYIFLNSFRGSTEESLAPALGKYFYQIFNRILIENEIPYRLVSLYGGGAEYPPMQADEEASLYPLLMVNEKQWEHLIDQEHFEQGPLHEKFFNPTWYKLNVSGNKSVFKILSKNQIQGLLTRLEAVNYYEGVNPESMAEYKKRWPRSFVYASEMLLIPEQIIYVSHYRGAEANALEVLDDLRRISKGHFVPRDSTQSELSEQDSLRVTFLWDDQAYEKTFSQEEKGFVISVMKWVNELLGEDVGQFYATKSSEESYLLSWNNILFLTPAQYQFVQKEGYLELLE